MKRIIAQVLGLMLLFACNREENITPGNPSSGLLSISAHMPELEILTKAGGETRPVYAYLCSKLLNDEIDPVSPKLAAGKMYQYEIPDGKQDILFSTFNSNTEGEIKAIPSAMGLLEVIQPDSAAGTGQDLLFGYLGDAESGNDQAYQVNLRRVVAKLKVQLRLVIDNDTIAETTDLLSGAEVCIGGFNRNLLFSVYGEPSWSGETALVLPLQNDAANGLSVDDIYTFPSVQAQHTLELKIMQPDGSGRNFRTTVQQALEANKYYTMTLYLKKNNADMNFYLGDVEVKQSVITNYNKEQSSLLNVSSEELYMGKEAGNTQKVVVATRLNGWNAQVTEGEEWLGLGKTQGVSGDTLAVSTLTENTAEFRTGKILVSSGQYKQEILVQQTNGELQTITLDFTGTGGYCSLDILGKNYTVDFGNGEGPQQPADPSRINTFYKSSGCTLVTISGEHLIEVVDKNRGYNEFISSATLSKCYSLKTLKLYGLREAKLDFSEAPNLKELDFTNGLCSEINLAANTSLEKLTCRDCENITTLDVSMINATLKELDCGGCGKLNVVEIYPQGYTGERILEKLIMDYCEVFPGVNTNNYTKLRELNISDCLELGAVRADNCPALQNLRMSNCKKMTTLSVQNCTSLRELNLSGLSQLSVVLTTGCDNLESVECNSCDELTKIDYSGYKNLNKLSCSYCYKLTDIVLIGCTALQEFDMAGSAPVNMDFTDCSSLNTLYLYCKKTTGLLLEGCSALKELTLDKPKMQQFNPGQCPALEKFILTNNDLNEGLNSLDFSRNISLKSCEVNYDRNLTTLNLSACDELERVILSECYQLQALQLGGQNTLKELTCKNDYEMSGFKFTRLDLTGFTALTDLTLKHLESTTDIVLSGCTALANYKGNDNPNVTSIAMTGCTGLKMFDCSSNPNINYLDFTGCRSLTEVDCRYCAFTAEDLNVMFESLPDQSDQVNMGKLKVSGNPGTDACDKTIAVNKNWYFINN